MIESLIYEKNTISGGNIFGGLNTVLFVDNNIENPSNSVSLVTEIADLLFPESIDDLRVTYFESILLDNYNKDYWKSAWLLYKNSGDNSTIKNRLDALIIAMINAAEFQLM